MDPVIQERRELGTLLRSVVKVLAVGDAPDYDQPWQTRGTETSVGSGAIIETPRGLRILTNAHCVADAVYVEVRRYGIARKFPAEVEVAGHECDLALLTVLDDGFYAGTTPMPLGGLPHLSDQVSVCGYPIGGERLSITQGIVSRIDLVHYAQSQRHLLAIQIDAAINAGNSGGPVLVDGHIVGVAFQSLDEAEKIGYMIAVPVIEHFLEDVADGVYDGFPALGATTQPLESPTQRRSLGLGPDEDRGVRVTRVGWGSSAWGILRAGDVLLAVDGVPISADGTIPLRDGEIVDFSYAFARRHVGEKAKVTVSRRGSEIECVLPLKRPRALVPEERHDLSPSYFVFGGLLFVPLTRNYLQTWGEHFWQNAPRDLVGYYERGLPTSDRHEVVVLQKVLADRVNQGYHDVESLVISEADGVPLRSIAHLVELVDSGRGETVSFEAEDGRVLVLDRGEARSARDRILDRFGVPEDRSSDLDHPPAPDGGSDRDQAVDRDRAPDRDR